MLSRVVTNLVRDALNDSALVTWTDADLIKYLNNAVLAIVTIRPDASYVTESITLAAGTRQSLPANRRRLIRVIRNASGGESIRKIDKDILDTLDPDWHQTTGSVVKEYAYNEKSPKEFWVYPGVTGSVDVDITCTSIPATVSDLDADDFPLDDSYSPAAVEHMLYQAWGGDDESTPTYAKSAQRLNNFYSILGQKTQTDVGMADQ